MKPSCPSEETIADFIEARLIGKLKHEFEQHVSTCKTCSQEIEISRKLIRNKNLASQQRVPTHVTDAAVSLVSNQMTKPVDRVKKHLGQSIKQIYSKITDQITLTLSGNQYLVPVRGGQQAEPMDTVVLRKKFSEFDTEIEFVRTRSGNSDITIRLMDEINKQSGMRLTLIKAERELISDPFDKEGHVLFEDVPQGSYRLVLNRNGTKMGSYAFRIQAKE